MAAANRTRHNRLVAINAVGLKDSPLSGSLYAARLIASDRARQREAIEEHNPA
jgi:hypothetical protein